MGYVIDKLGRTKVALLRGCFCLAFSLWLSNGATPSGSDIDLIPIGEPCGLEDGEEAEACEAATTNRLNPAPSRPENAVNAELTGESTTAEDDDEVLAPAEARP
jgi:hypothetical protein